MHHEPGTITIPLQLLWKLYEYAQDLASEWAWKRDETRPGYADVYAELLQIIDATWQYFPDDVTTH